MEDEGFLDVARTFRNISKVEKEHEERYLKLAENIKNNEVYSKSETTTWKCRKCGHIHEGTEAPGACPVCKHKKEYFEPEDMWQL